MNATQVQNDSLAFAGNILDWHDSHDRQKPGLQELTGISQHGRATTSGLNDFDYASLGYLTSDHVHKLQQLRTVTKSSIPNEILEHFKHIKCHCTMGLFPEIGRAWLTIDSDIYIWTYDTARDVAYYDGLSHLIVSVGLVKPKTGVFVKDLKYLLLLTTPIEIIVLGVTFDGAPLATTRPLDDGNNEMQLMNKPIFVIGTDNVPINVIQGSQDGRIFLGGRDGNLYEICYRAESSWFGKRCKKINLSQSIVSLMVPSFLKVFSEVDPIERIAIDNSRNILYLLTSKSCIEAWDIGTDYANVQRIGRITQSDIVNQAINLIKTVDPSIFKCIKAICPLTSEDSNNLHLVAVTECGVRLYFSTKSLHVQHQLMQSESLGYSAPMNPASYPVNRVTPNGLYLFHVRLPPGYTPNATTNKPKQVHAAHYSEGTILMVTTKQQEQDILWSVSSAPFTNLNYLIESTALEPLDGIVWSLAEVRIPCKPQHSSLLYNARTTRKVALLTNQGTHIIEILKASNILQQILSACNGPHHEAVKAFFHNQTTREACATALLLATSEEFRGGDIATWATQAFLMYGGDPTYQHPLDASKRNMLSPAMGSNQDREQPPVFMSTPMPNSGAMPMGSPHSRTTSASYAQPISPIRHSQNTAPPGNENRLIVYSAKHDGMYLYVSRMIGSIWQLQCVDENLCSRLNANDCLLLLADLRSLSRFLDSHSVHEFSATKRFPYDSHIGTSGYSTLMMNNSHIMLNEQRNITEQAQLEEKKSLSALTHFVKHACEVLSLWSLLLGHQFQLLCLQLSPDNQKMLRCCTFRELLLTRSDVCAFLIISLINLYLKDKASVTEVSNSLRELCPNLYRQEDAVTYKATEILLSAKNCTSSAEKELKLRTTLQMCKDAAPTLPVHSICQQFVAAEFYEGVIELAFTCAAKSDPEEIGIHYYNNDEPSEDREGYACFATRMSYYKEVKMMFDHVYQSVCNKKADMDQSQSYSGTDSHDTDNEPNSKIMKIVAQALRRKDPLLHVTVYSWLLMHDMLSELLNVVEPSLGEYLRRSAGRTPDDIKLIDLLWKYYEKNGHHCQAAQILDNLAMTRSDTISLDSRIGYLVRAVLCLRNDSIGAVKTNGSFLKELEDKLEIARVQNAVLIDISALAHSNPSASQAEKELNAALYDMTQLYQNFAEPFDLWECQLSILNCSHHNDPLLIENVWGNIIRNAVEAPGSVEERSTRLFCKIEQLVRMFGESGACFPFAFLIRELEIKACQLRLPEGTVPEKLVAMKLDEELLLEYYSRMISMNERIWANEGNEWHLIQSALRVVSLLADNAPSIFYRSKRRIIGKALDIVAVCLSICYQKPDTSRMQHTLKELQCRLQRHLG